MLEKVHAQNVRFMISVWPKFYPGTDNYKELDAAGFMYHGNIDAGAHRLGRARATINSFYDPYAKAARDIYWRQLNENLNVLGIDAWWMDATEPDLHSNLDIDSIKARIGPTAMGPAENYFNSYPLVHTGGVYEGSRQVSPDKRVFILTRSGFAGMQRHAAAVWSGDIASRWDDLYNQISAGVSVGYSGLPNWTFDIGGFANEARYSTQKPAAADLEEWRELNLRWFQFGAFAPIVPLAWRISVPRDLQSRAARIGGLRQPRVARQAALPPAAVHLHGGRRHLSSRRHHHARPRHGLRRRRRRARRARRVPVRQGVPRGAGVQAQGAHAGRSIYRRAPPGTTSTRGAQHAGGESVEAAAPLTRMPLYVRAGSIVPVGPDIQYTAEKPGAPITLFVFTGADGSFDYYEDDGVSYGYERGEFARIPLRYDAAKGTLTIGARSGSYPGMPEKRTFKVRWIKAGGKAPAELDAAADASVEYKGAEITVGM